MGRVSSYRGRKNNYMGAFLALSSLAVMSYMAGSLARFAGELNDTKTEHDIKKKPVPAKSTTWVQDYQMTKCKASQTHIKPGTAVGQTVLVTGAAGLVGQHVVRYCATVLGARVIAVDEKEIDFVGIRRNKTRFLKGSLLDEGFVADIFSWYNSFDAVYHLADHSSPTLSKFFPAANYKDNLLAGIYVLNGAIRSHAKFFVYLSTFSAFGKPGPVYTETMSTEPIDPYGIAKMAMEHQLLAAVQHFDLKYSILRVNEVFGPGMELSDLADGTVSAIIYQAHKGKSIVVPSKDESHPVSLSFVKDLAPLVAQTPYVPGAINQIINMGTGEKVTYEDVVNALAAAFGNVSVTYDRHKAQMKPMQVSFQKMRCLFEPPVRPSLLQAMDETARWVRRHPDSMKPRPSSKLELGKYLDKGVSHQLGSH